MNSATKKKTLELQALATESLQSGRGSLLGLPKGLLGVRGLGFRGWRVEGLRGLGV